MQQTINVEMTATTYGTAISVQGGNFLAAIGKDDLNPGKWAASWQPYGTCNNCTYAGALEYITRCIKEHFNRFGINVKFIS